MRCSSKGKGTLSRVWWRTTKRVDGRWVRHSYQFLLAQLGGTDNTSPQMWRSAVNRAPCLFEARYGPAALLLNMPAINEFVDAFYRRCVALGPCTRPEAHAFERLKAPPGDAEGDPGAPGRGVRGMGGRHVSQSPDRADPGVILPDANSPS